MATVPTARKTAENASKTVERALEQAVYNRPTTSGQLFIHSFIPVLCHCPSRDGSVLENASKP
ncbi:MAG TPA: hypothetical protein VFK72_09375 [Nevskia sp.]|nr:hypothetical protein [Nevskia sp.]